MLEQSRSRNKPKQFSRTKWTTEKWLEVEPKLDRTRTKREKEKRRTRKKREGADKKGRRSRQKFQKGQGYNFSTERRL